MPEEKNISPEKKVDLLWDMYKLLNAESGDLEKEMLRCFIYAAVVIGLPFGLNKAFKLDNNPLLLPLIPFAILLVYYYYLTLMHLIICISIHKAGIEYKINDIAGDDRLLNYNLQFVDEIYADVLPKYKRIRVPTPNLILALLLLGAIVTLTIYMQLLKSTWMIVIFYSICLITCLITLYIFFALSKNLKKKWWTPKNGLPTPSQSHS